MVFPEPGDGNQFSLVRAEERGGHEGDKENSLSNSAAQAMFAYLKLLRWSMPSPSPFSRWGIPAAARVVHNRAPQNAEDRSAVPSALLPPRVVETEGRDPLQILGDVFGYHSFRRDQEPIMRRVIGGSDALVLMPTGGGKSLCYQVPGLARPGLAVVISPLVALMYDQVARLRECGVAAEQLNSDMDFEERRRVERQVRDGSVKLLYVAPERFVTESFLDLLRQTKVGTFAIDEAHCVSQWGHNFRPEYMRIGEACAQFPDVPRIAVTATASPGTLKDMIQNLRLQNAEVFKSSFDRPNISYSVVDRADQNRQLLNFLADHRGESGVVYCGSRNKTETVSEFLRKNGFDAVHYHAKLPKEEKRENQDRFIKGEGIIAVATIAFGMGIDKPDVRFVAHLDLPDSLEAYYQETGRAGRDGLPAVAWMSYGAGDIKMRRDRIFLDKEHSEEYRRLAFGRLQSLVSMVESGECRRGVVLRYFGEDHKGGCGQCDRCLNPVETFDGTEAAQKVLSAAARTGQRYGAGLLVDILTGNASEKIRRTGLDRIKTFGAGSEKSREWWNHIVRQVYAADLLEAPPELDGGFRMTETGHEVLLKGRTIQLVEPPSGYGRTRVRNSPRTQMTLTQGVPEARKALFEDLRSMRKEMAQRQNLPPYAIFHDATLIEIVSAMPDTLSQLDRIPGIGASKQARYGVEILAIVARHRENSPREDRISLPGFGPGR